jgi:GMP synthase (glutamine-hydrolysing)
MTRFVLIQARTTDEVVGPEEHASFAQHLGVDVAQITAVTALDGPLDIDRLTDRCDAILVGGSGKFGVTDDVSWLADFFDLLGELADRDVPMFASCFGFQGLCMALGAPVETIKAFSEVGTMVVEPTADAMEDPVFGMLPARFNAQLGHKDSATRLPEGAIWLARSERCPYQAMRLGQNVYATQFHPELDGDTNRRRFEQYYVQYSAAMGEQKARALLEAFQPSAEASALLGRFAASLS